MGRHRSTWDKSDSYAGAGSEQQRQAAARKRELLARLAATPKKTPKAEEPEEVSPIRQSRDCEAYVTALNELPLYALGDLEDALLSDEYRGIVEAAVGSADSGESRALLVWPPEAFSPSAVVGLMTLAATGAAERIETTVSDATSWSRRGAEPVRVAIFPYARSTHSSARRVQVDAKCIGEINFEHFMRTVDDISDPSKDYHQVMSRVRSLDGRAKDGKSYPEFRHPILDEVVAHGPPSGVGNSNSSLLWRTLRKTDIVRQARSGTADDPSLARFFAFELRPSDRIGVVIRSLKAPINLLLIDLTKTGRQRLGWNWSARAREVVECMREVHPSVGMLAITDDPWTFSSTRFDVLGERKYGKKSKLLPAPGETILGLSGGILSAGFEPDFEPVESILVNGFYGQAGNVSEELRHLSFKIADAGDRKSSDLVKDLGVIVRRAASLPGSVGDFSQFLESETTAAIASDRIAAYRSAGLIADLSEPDCIASQIDVGATVRRRVEELMSGLTEATPMSTLLDETLVPCLRSSSKSVFIFRSDMIAEFAAHRMANNRKLAERLESGMIVFGGNDALDAIAASHSASRNQFKKLVLVALTRSTILKFFARPWLPENISVLADADTLAYSGRDAERLSGDLGDHAIAERLSKFSNAAATRVCEIGRHATNLDKVPPLDDLDLTDTSVIDLSGGSRGARQLLQFTLHSGQRILARKGTILVLRDDAAATTSFVERQASDVKEGDEMCAIGPAFIERARNLVNIRAAAAEEIRTYHEEVLERFSRMPGASVSAKIRSLAEAMGDPGCAAKARYWVDIEEEIDKPMHEVVPHAPHDRETFMKFTTALGISQRIAENFWLWAIVAQRSHRMRSGTLFHDAFRGILTDPHAALAQNRDRQSDIRSLRLMAEEHVSMVQSIKKVSAA